MVSACATLALTVGVGTGTTSGVAHSPRAGLPLSQAGAKFAA